MHLPGEPAGVLEALLLSEICFLLTFGRDGLGSKSWFIVQSLDLNMTSCGRSSVCLVCASSLYHLQMKIDARPSARTAPKLESKP
jgi:hypothetical protein